MKHFLTILLIVNGLLLPCGCLSGLTLVGFAFDMSIKLGFITDIHITNDTQQPIKITPIGTVGSQGDRSPLHDIHRKQPTYDSQTRGSFEILPGDSIELFYDWDDINFSEIVIEDQAGSLSQLVVDPTPTQEQYHPPTPNTFTIDNQSPLVPVSLNVLAAYHEAQHPPHLVWYVYVLFLPWITFAILLWMRLRVVKRGKVKEMPNAAEN